MISILQQVQTDKKRNTELPIVGLKEKGNKPNECKGNGTKQILYKACAVYMLNLLKNCNTQNAKRKGKHDIA